MKTHYLVLTPSWLEAHVECKAKVTYHHVTSIHTEVTCQNCKKTKAYKNAVRNK